MGTHRRRIWRENMNANMLLLCFLGSVNAFGSYPATPDCGNSANMRSVVHQFKEGTADAWWAYFADPDVFANFLAQNALDGTYMHYFLPDTDGTINCLWETDGCWSDEKFQAWIDGPTGPGFMPETAPLPYDNVFVNTPYMGTTAIAPAPHFPTPPPEEECKTPEGSVYWVKHTFVEGPTADAWIEGLATFDFPGYEAFNLANGVNNPQFLLPSTDTSPGDMSPDCMCVWETAAPMTADEFQAFIDGPLGPGEGVFINTPHEVVPGGKMPCSVF